MCYTGKLIKKNKNYTHPQNTLQWDVFGFGWPHANNKIKNRNITKITSIPSQL
jgi:hypothetical protein